MNRYNKIGVIGAGNIGIGVATDLILHNIKCTLIDISDTILDKAKSEVKKKYKICTFIS